MAEHRTITIRPGATALTIAGSDPSGGAGLQADLKTFQQLGVYGMSVVTLLTVQNTQGVSRVEVLAPDLVAEQLIAVLDDIPPRAIKTGALGSAEVVEAVSDLLQAVDVPIVIDPVLISKHGHALADAQVVESVVRHLLPLADLITPNRLEAERLTGLTLATEQDVAEAIYRLQQAGAQHVLIKLGEVNGLSYNILSLDGENLCIQTPHISQAPNTHGTGCILAAAITAHLAIGGRDMHSCVSRAVDQVYQAIYCNTELGHGIHPAETRVIQAESHPEA